MKKQVKRAPKGTMRRVLSYLKGYRLYLFLSLLLAALSVGYAAEDPAPRPRKPLAEILHNERW